jgi:serine/threonine-protein kinase
MLVDGGVQQAGDSVRFTVKVVGPDSRVVWASTYEGAMADLFQLQARAADEMASALGIAASPRERERIARTPAASVDAYADYSMGRALLAREDVAGNAEKAVAAFARAVAKDPRFALAYAGLGDACWWRYRETNDASWVSRSTDSIRHALDLDPVDSRIRVSLATVYIGTGKSREAIAELRPAIARRPNDDEARRLLAEALASQGWSEEALQEYRQAIAVRPNAFRNHSALGGFYFRAGRYAEAAAAYQSVTEVQPDSTWGFINLGAAYLAAGDNRRALENFQRSLTLAPEPEAYSNIGTIHYAEGRYQDAAIAYERAVALGPRNPISHRNLGDAYLRLGARDKARAEYRQAVDLTGDLLKVNPRDARMLASHALYLAKAGRRTEALRDAGKAAAMKPGDAEVLYTRAAVHALCGQPREAADWLERALAKGYSRELAREDDDLASIRTLPRVRAALRDVRVP